MGDDPIAWNAMKERRKEERQRKAIAEAKKLAEKFGTEILAEAPLQDEFPMQHKEWGKEILDYWEREKEFIQWGFARAPGVNKNQLYELCSYS